MEYSAYLYNFQPKPFRVGLIIALDWPTKESAKDAAIHRIKNADLPEDIRRFLQRHLTVKSLSDTQNQFGHSEWTAFRQGQLPIYQNYPIISWENFIAPTEEWETIQKSVYQAIQEITDEYEKTLTPIYHQGYKAGWDAAIRHFQKKIINTANDSHPLPQLPTQESE